MKPILPSPVDRYFSGKHDGSFDLRAFSRDAVVHDESNTHRGHAEINAWQAAARQKYDFHAEPQELTNDAGDVIVRAKVSGNFPNSPVMLHYRFTLCDGLIHRLSIS